MPAIVLSQIGECDADKGLAWLTTVAYPVDSPIDPKWGPRTSRKTGKVRTPPANANDVHQDDFKAALRKAVTGKREPDEDSLRRGIEWLVRALVVGRVLAERLAGDENRSRGDIDTDAAHDLAELFKIAWPNRKSKNSGAKPEDAGEASNNRDEAFSERTMHDLPPYFRRVLPHCLALFLCVNRHNVVEFRESVPSRKVARRKALKYLWLHGHSNDDRPEAEDAHIRHEVTKKRLSDFYTVVAHVAAGDYDMITELVHTARAVAPFIKRAVDLDMSDTIEIRINRRLSRMAVIYERPDRFSATAANLDEALAQQLCSNAEVSYGEGLCRK